MNQNTFKKCIALFTGTSDVFTNPTLVSFFELLQKKKIRVLLFSYEQLIAPPSYFDNISYHFLPPLELTGGGYKNIFTSFKIYLHTIKILKQYKVNHLFGVDYYGFNIAARFKRFISGARLGYFSFELLFLDEIKQQKFIDLKKKEIQNLKQLDYLIIQDDVRLALFLTENGLQPAPYFKIFKIPVAPQKMAMDKIAGWDLYKKLDIPQNKRTVVYSGSIGNWAGSEQLLDLLENHWNPKFWLVIHSRLPLKKEDEYLIRINKLIAGGHPLSLHANPFDNYSDYAAFLKNFDLAMVLYKSQNDSMYFGKNLKEIGLASGKFSMYLMMGIPVIASDQTSYKNLLKQFNFGGVIEHNENFSELLEYCYKNREELSKNALMLYDSVLDPEKQLYSLIELLN